MISSIRNPLVRRVLVLTLGPVWFAMMLAVRIVAEAWDLWCDLWDAW